MKNIDVDELDDAIQACMAICKAIYNHAVRMGFSDGQAMIMATQYMRGMLLEGGRR